MLVHYNKNSLGVAACNKSLKLPYRKKRSARAIVQFSSHTACKHCIRAAIKDRRRDRGQRMLFKELEL